MKNSILLLLLVAVILSLSSCSRKCCSEPEGFFIEILYKTKDGKDLFSTPMNNDKGRYDTRKIEIYKVIKNNDVVTKEPLDTWVKRREALGNTGYSSLSLTPLPTDDKRVTGLLFYLYPGTEVDTLSYKGEGKYNFPQTKNLFYNSTCVEKLKFYRSGSFSEETIHYTLIVTKPD